MATIEKRKSGFILTPKNKDEAILLLIFHKDMSCHIGKSIDKFSHTLVYNGLMPTIFADSEEYINLWKRNIEDMIFLSQNIMLGLAT